MSRTTITQLKKLPWNSATATLFISKRRLGGNRKAHYDLYQVKIDSRLEQRLISNTRNKVEASNKIEDYDYLTADQDGTLLNIDVNETDMESILKELQSVQTPNLIQSENELIGSWAYIARIDFPKAKPLYSIRKVSDSWTTKRVKEKSIIIVQKIYLARSWRQRGV